MTWSSMMGGLETLGGLMAAAGFWPDVMGIAAAVSGPIGAITLIAAFILYFATKQSTDARALDEIVRGEKLLSSKALIVILAQFKDDSKRLSALQAVLKEESGRAETIYGRVKNEVDIERLLKSQQSHAYQRLWKVGSFFVALALILYLVSVLTNGGGSEAKRGSVLILPDKSSSVLIDENEDCLGPETTFMLHSLATKRRIPLPHCGILVRAKKPTPVQLKLREDVTRVLSSATSPIEIPDVDLDALGATFRLEVNDGGSYRSCKNEPIRIDSTTYEEQGVWLIDVVSSCI